MRCVKAPSSESPSVECCEIIFSVLFLAEGREQEPHSLVRCVFTRFIQPLTMVTFSEGRERCSQNKPFLLAERARM